MKKNFKLVLALIVAVLMIAGSISAVAAPTPVTITPPASPSELTTDSTSYDDTLTIKGLMKDDVVNLYQVLYWAGNDDAITPKYGGWAVADTFSSVLDTEEKLRIMLYDNQEAEPPVSAQYVKSELAGQLARLVNTNTAKAATATVADGETSVAFTVNGNPGMYVALITPADQDVVYNPVFVSSDFNKENPSASWEITESATYSDSAAAKKSKTELDKKADTTEDAWDEKSAGDIATSAAAVGATGKLKWTTTAIGDTVSFTVTTTIPGFGEVYTNPFFKMTDTLTDLKLVDGSVQVTDPAAAAAAAHIVEGTNQYTIDWNTEAGKAYLKTLSVPTKVTVTYQAIVTETAPANVNLERNEISTEFSHNPSDENDHGFKKDTTQHYTFSIDANSIYEDETGNKIGRSGTEIVKVGQDAEGNPIKTSSSWSSIEDGTKEEVKGPLEGAVFGLYTYTGDKTVDQLTDADLTAYVPKTSAGAAGEPMTNLTTGADGRMTITGLDAGKYYLKEITAPAGYVKSNEIIPIEITTEVEKIEVTEWTIDGVNWYKTAAEAGTDAKSYTYQTEVLKSYSIKVGNTTTTHRFAHTSDSAGITWIESSSVEIPSSIINVKGVELPSTGGIGTTIFYVGGSLMVLAAAILLITKRRMGVED